MRCSAHEVGGVTVVTRYEEQSAVPGLVGKVVALIAEGYQYRTAVNVTHWDLPRRQLSA